MVIQFVRKDMDVNEHKRLSNFTLRYTLKEKNSAFYFSVTEGSSKMGITHTLK